MKTVTFGNTGLKPSAVCLGCMSFGSKTWRDWVLEGAEANRLLGQALDAGITFFDTANVYSSGESERLLGAFLKGAAARDKVIVSTKCFYPSPRNSGMVGLGRANILASIDDSLSRLGMDYVDVFQVHRWDDKTPVEETMAALAEVVKSGKARFAGASNMRTWHLAKSQLAAQNIDFRGYATMQHHYNLLYREDERDLIPFCRDQGIGLMCWSPLARGRLGRAGQAATSAREKTDWVADALYGAPDDPILAAVAEIADERGVPPAQIALAWIIAEGVIPVVGVTKDKHVADAIAAAALTLTDDEMARLDGAYTPRPLAELPWGDRKQTDPRDTVPTPAKTGV